MKSLRGLTIVRSVLLLAMACSPERLLSPPVAPQSGVGPMDARRNVTGSCVITAPTMHDSTNTSTYRVFNASCAYVFNRQFGLESHQPNTWWLQQGRNCYVTTQNTDENIRCYVYPDPSGIGPIPLFIYSIPVPSYIVIRLRNGVASKTFERPRFWIRTKSAVHGVRG